MAKKKKKRRKKRRKPIVSKDLLDHIDIDKIPIPKPTNGRPRVYPEGTKVTYVRMNINNWRWLKLHFGSVTRGIFVAVELLKKYME